MAKRRGPRLFIYLEISMIALGFLFATCITDPSGKVRADLAQLGKIDLSVIETSGSASEVFERNLERPTYDIDPGMPFIGIRAAVNKTLSQVEAGEPPDSLAVGLKVQMAEGRSCWLILHTSEIEKVNYKYSPILGDVFECGVRKEISFHSLGGEASAEFKDQDFFPALQEASNRMRVNLDVNKVRVIGVYPFSRTILDNEGGIAISVQVHSFFPLSFYDLSTVTLGGRELYVENGIARLEMRPGIYEVEAVAHGRAIFFPSSISTKMTINISSSEGLEVEYFIR